MDVHNIRLLDLLPAYFQEDITIKGLCAAADCILRTLVYEVKKTDFIPNLDLLKENELDYVAKTIGIPWYNDSDSMEIKINVIKNAESIFWSLGTVYAVEKVIKDIFGFGEVTEWFDYGGDKNRFKVMTSAIMNEQNLNRATALIRKVKRTQAQMDGFDKMNELNGNKYFGSGTLVTKYIKIMTGGVLNV